MRLSLLDRLFLVCSNLKQERSMVSIASMARCSGSSTASATPIATPLLEPNYEAGERLSQFERGAPIERHCPSASDRNNDGIHPIL
jgi:hypothetical protein